MAWQQALQQKLAQRQSDNLYRHRRQLQCAQGPHIVVDGKPCTNFSSNDYLGLANEPRVKKAFSQAANKYGVGSGASHLVCGHSEEHHLLEQELACFTGRDRALLFSTGYMANLGTVNALLGKGDTVIEDKLNHASLLDAGQLSGARMQRYLHNDMAQLERRLSVAQGRTLVVVDGVFSMDGDCAPIDTLAEMTAQHDALLMVDDAHGFGVLGPNGAGVVEQYGLCQQAVPIFMATLGKSLGCFGAFVAGSEALIETLLQEARTYIYTTALPPAVAAATRESLRLVEGEPWRRQHLRDLVQRLRAGLDSLGLATLPSTTPIQPVIVGAADDALALSEVLFAKGFYVPAIRPPTVPAGSSRLRITLSAAHAQQDIDNLLGALGELVL